MKEYHKIEGLFKRDEDTKRLLEGQYRNEAVELLKDCEWQFTEKFDGTNVRVVWDGHKVSFHGRTDRAILPVPLAEVLIDLFAGEVNEQIFEEHFGDTEVILYGEGYGAKIQKGGGNYRSDNSFVLFDVQVGDLFLTRENVENVARYFGIDVVPIVLTGTIGAAIDFVKQRPKSTVGTADMEGVVGRPKVELRDRRGNRIIVKIKVRDMDEIDKWKK